MDTSTSTNQEILTLDEIKSRYPDQWVLIAYTELDENLEVVRGEVVAYGSEYEQLFEDDSAREGKSLAIDYTGVVDDEIAVML